MVGRAARLRRRAASVRQRRAHRISGTGSSLELDGAQARILTSGGSASGLGGLANNYGTLTLRGGNNIGSGAGGAAITTTTAFSNHATFNVDSNYGDGGSTASFGGVFSNFATATIGNYALSASTTVSATGLASNGVLTIQGNTTGGTSNQAAVKISGAAPGTWSGALRVSGDALLQFGSGVLTGIGTGSSLELDGAQARILTSGGSASGLGGLANNYGTLLLRGGNNIGSGAGGAAITTTTAFANHATFNVDSNYGDGGSTASFGGVFTNYATTTIGNYALTASTTVSATGLANNSVLTIQGNATGGTTNQAALKISGAGPGTWSGALRVSGDALLQFGSGGITAVGADSLLELRRRPGADPDQRRLGFGPWRAGHKQRHAVSDRQRLLWLWRRRRDGLDHYRFQQ